MQIDADVLIVGSGPAGVSAAFPLLNAGLRVLMIDPATGVSARASEIPFLQRRGEDAEQWRWMNGQSHYALAMRSSASPKLRVPAHAYVFSGFAEANRIVSEGGYAAIGSIATGGLSNAWGCGVACLTQSELGSYPVDEAEMRLSYQRIVERIAVSGRNDDDLREYFGLDEWAQKPIAMGILQQWVFEQYEKKKSAVQANGLRVGRSRIAVLSEAADARSACNICGNCLWGCGRAALYSAADELIALKRFPNFHIAHGYVAEHIETQRDHCRVLARARAGGELRSFEAKRVVLAAGTLATTRLVLSALTVRTPVRLYSCPTAAFLLWVPRFLGASVQRDFGLGQLSFTAELGDQVQGFGSLFSTAGIPVSEFAAYVPLARPHAIRVLKRLLPSCVAGNVFFPGEFSRASVQLDSAGSLVVSGRHAEDVEAWAERARTVIRRGFMRTGAFLLPGSFSLGQPGSDMHYTGTLPMSERPAVGQTSPSGEVTGLPGVYVVDGACLLPFPAKSHTLTIMANADRIAGRIARSLSNQLTQPVTPQ